MKPPARLAILLALTGCASVYRVGAISVEPTGGAGFAGIRTANLIQTPALSVPAGCTGRCAAVVLTDSVDLTPNRHYEWRPALSTGVAFERYGPSGVGGGVGLSIVLVPGAEGTTAPWPALTVHLGTQRAGFFAGMVFAPTDKVELPPGVTSLRVKRDAIPDLVTRRNGRAGNLVFGVRIGPSARDTTRAP